MLVCLRQVETPALEAVVRAAAVSISQGGSLHFVVWSASDKHWSKHAAAAQCVVRMGRFACGSTISCQQQQQQQQHQQQ
jgi:hypothetical protein